MAAIDATASGIKKEEMKKGVEILEIVAGQKVTMEFLVTRLSTIIEMALDRGEDGEKLRDEVMEVIKKFDIDMDDLRKRIANNAFCLAIGFRQAKKNKK